MRFYISAHPIFPGHQKGLGIYTTGYVKSVSVGKVLSSLVKKGHTKINSFYDEDNERIVFHCSQGDQ